ncbi:MAG: ABC transporter permease [Candidatus Bathyarchaeota archaeon]|nr:MAG: ABC transporter permease [Candidatus Bathyarchaeota archaeon]
MMDTEPHIMRMLSESYGVYDPPHIQYLKYLRVMFSFGVVPPYFGWSTVHHEFVAQGLYWRLPITLLLLGTALAVQMIIGILLGVFAASRRGKKLDVAAIGVSIITWCIPAFVLQLLAILLFSFIMWETGIEIFSISFFPPPFVEHDLAWWLQVLWELTLPILTLVVTGFAYWVLMTRNTLIDALTQDYVVTARAKGLSERQVLFKHAFKSIHPQIATMIAFSLPSLVTGSIVTEYIFGIEGIGKYFLRLFWREGMVIVILDSAATAAVFFIYATLIVVCNLIVDLIYGILDPRIRISAPGGRK